MSVFTKILQVTGGVVHGGHCVDHLQEATELNIIHFFPISCKYLIWCVTVEQNQANKVYCL